MDQLEAARDEAEAMRKKHQPTEEETIEVFVGALAYICDGDERRFVDFMVTHHGMEPEQATALATLVGGILQERLANGEPIMRPG